MMSPSLQRDRKIYKHLLVNFATANWNADPCSFYWSKGGLGLRGYGECLLEIQQQFHLFSMGSGRPNTSHNLE
jgi:hypothetical protein